MKEKLRKKLLQIRIQQAPDDKAPKDKLIIQKIEELPEFQNANTILTYISIHGEVDLAELFNKYKKDKAFTVPRITNDKQTLTFYKINTLEDLEKGTYNIPEPKQNLEKIPLEEIDLVIVPGIAYAKNGHRVGYGGGFYDRLLPKITCPKIGVAYEFQIVKNIECEDHDKPVDIIISEQEVININNNS